MIRSARSRNTGLVALVYASLAVMAASCALRHVDPSNGHTHPGSHEGGSAQRALRLGLSGHARCWAHDGAFSVINESGRATGGLVSQPENPFTLLFPTPLPCASLGSFFLIG
jgi:hypothetical protein